MCIRDSVHAAQAAIDRKQHKRDQARQRAMLAPLKKKVDKFEKLLDNATNTLAGIREKLGAEELYTSENKSELNELLSAEAEARRQVDLAEHQLLESMEALENADGTAT